MLYSCPFIVIEGNAALKGSTTLTSLRNTAIAVWILNTQKDVVDSCEVGFPQQLKSIVRQSINK